MRLVIDCFKLVKGTGKSIGIYNLTHNLVRALAKENKKNEIIVLGNNYNKADFNVKGVRFIKVKYNPYNKLVCIVWELLLISCVLKRVNADRVLFPRGFAPLSHKIEDYIIIHDMIPFYYNNYYPNVLNKYENFYVMWRLKVSARGCKKVLTDSKASKHQIIKIAGVPSGKIEVVYPGLNMINVSSNDNLKTYPSYISAIASGLPHKNLKAIVNSYVEYCKIAAQPLPLTIIGVADVEHFSVLDDVKKRITCYPYFEKDDDLYQMIGNSDLFLFLSEIEGFGFPPLEAMQLGVPVICSNRSSLPEVTGDAALLVDPDDVKNTASLIDMVCTNTNYREKMIVKGYKNCQRFIWSERVESYIEQLFS